MVRSSQLKKWNKIEKMIKVGIPDVVWCYSDKKKSIATFQDPLRLKKNSVQDILSLQLDLQNYVDNFSNYDFDAKREVDISVPTTVVPEGVYKSERCFLPLRGGALESIHKILVMIYRLSNVWTGSLRSFGWLRDEVLPERKELAECGFIRDSNKNGMDITFFQWCDEDFNTGRRVLKVVQHISNSLAEWVKAGGIRFNLEDRNTSKKRAGLKSYVKAVMQEVKEPYIMRFLLTYDPRYRFGRERVGDIVSIWKTLISERKNLFWENVKGFFWKVEAVGEVENGMRANQPIWGVQLVLILDYGLSVSNERVITESLWRAWFDLNYEHFSKTDDQFRHSSKKEDLTPCNSPFPIYSVLVSQSKLLPRLKKNLNGNRQWRDSLNECLHGHFNKKDRRSEQALGYLIDYFVAFDVLIFCYSGSDVSELVNNTTNDQKYQRKMKMFGRGQIHKKHNSRKSRIINSELDRVD